MIYVERNRIYFMDEFARVCEGMYLVAIYVQLERKSLERYKRKLAFEIFKKKRYDFAGDYRLGHNIILV
jgi:hypothetical protein